MSVEVSIGVLADSLPRRKRPPGHYRQANIFQPDTIRDEDYSPLADSVPPKKF